MSWNLTVTKKPSENSSSFVYDITGFRQDASVGLGPFPYILDGNMISKYYTEILPLVTRSSIRSRSQALDNSSMAITQGGLVELGKMLYTAIRPDLRNALKNAKSIHLFTDELLIPWQLLHDGENFFSLEIPFGVSPQKSSTTERDSKIIRKLRILFLIDTLGDLPQSMMESKKILSLLSKNNNIDYHVIEGKKTSYGEVRTLLLREHFDIIHVAAHTKFDRTSPKDSGIIMNDSMLRTDDIYHSIKSDPPWLVFMNSCESSVSSDSEDYDEHSGLALSFLLAGASVYIGSNALINDWSASQMAVNFYESLLHGSTLGESMKNARLNFYENYPHDLSWTTFVLYGNPNQKVVFDENDLEYEIRKYLSTNKKISISKCAHDLRISIGRVREIISKMDSNQKILGEATSSTILSREKGMKKINNDSILDIIEDGENENLEFKGSLITGVKSKYEKKTIEFKDLRKILEKEVVQTIAAFMNTNGGKLFIGVSDDKEILGLQNDYNTLKEGQQNSDGFQIHLRQCVFSHTKDKRVNESFKVKFHTIEDKEICEVIVSATPEPVFILGQNGKLDECYVRVGNSSISYNVAEFFEYYNRHFQKQK